MYFSVKCQLSMCITYFLISLAGTIDSTYKFSKHFLIRDLNENILTILY